MFTFCCLQEFEMKSLAEEEAPMCAKVEKPLLATTQVTLVDPEDKYVTTVCNAQHYERALHVRHNHMRCAV